MHDRYDPSVRLRQIEEILAQVRPASHVDGRETNLAALNLSRVPVERIRQMTGVLEQRLNHEIDAVDAVALRMLVNDFAAAVAQLRAVTRLTGEQLTEIAGVVQEAQRLVPHPSEEPARPAREVVAAAPLIGLGMAGAALVFGTLIYYGVVTDTTKGGFDQTYTPARIKDGQIEPGHFK